MTSARKVGTPAAESCSAISCSVRVLPVPVAPAIRPCRLSIRSGTWTTASGVELLVVDARAEPERVTLRRVGRRDGRAPKSAVFACFATVRRPGRVERREQVDDVAVRVEHDGVALAPEGVPRLQVPAAAR